MPGRLAPVSDFPVDPFSWDCWVLLVFCCRLVCHRKSEMWLQRQGWNTRTVIAFDFICKLTLYCTLHTTHKQYILLEKYRATDSSNKYISSLPVGSIIVVKQTTPPNATREAEVTKDICRIKQGPCVMHYSYYSSAYRRLVYLLLLSLPWLFPGNVRGRAGKLMKRKL
jgi:hypothetical protein